MPLPLSQYHFEILPHDEASVKQWVPKYIEFRLNFLKAFPENFSASYEEEVLTPEAAWISLLCEPAYRVIIAVVRPDNNTLQHPVWENEWALNLSLYGPQCHHEIYHDNKNDCLESSWFVGTSFVAPQHRQRGMIHEAFYTAERAAVAEDRQTFQKQHEAQVLRPSGHRSQQFRTRMLGSSASKNPALFRYFGLVGLEISHTMKTGDLARWRWKIAVDPEKADEPTTVMQKLIPWEAEPLARL